MPNASLLLVDDEPFNLEILSSYLEGDEYQITTAKDGQRAWDLLLDHPDQFDVVLLDRKMPRKNGMEVLHNMKQHPSLSSIPVIMQTAAASSKDVIEGLEAGSYYYLTKPYQKELLIPIVRGAVSDAIRYKTLQQSLAQGSRTLGFMKSAEFQFQTLEEAQALATSLASTCPEPAKTALGLTELMVNAVEHGNLGISYQDKSRLIEQNTWLKEIERRGQLEENRHKFVNVHMENNPSNIRIQITDCGAGFDWNRYLQVDPSRAFDSHGRGIAMSNKISLDDIRFLEPGNSVIVTIMKKPH